jgi:hypothetical protein
MRHFLLIVLLLATCVITPCFAATDDLDTVAVIYVSHVLGTNRIAHQTLALPAPRTLVRLTDASSIPDSTGFLPSPDGQWLMVWEPDPSATKEGRTPTQWLVIRVRDGKSWQLGQTDTPSLLLPRWTDATHVVLEGDTTSATFDTKKQKLLTPLPRWQGPDEGRRARTEKRLLVFCRRDKVGTQAFLKAWPTVEKELQVNDLSPNPTEPKEFVLLRNFGIPGMGIIRQQDHSAIMRGMNRLPRVVMNPDGTRLAASFVTNIQTGNVWQWADACLDVFDIASGKSLWHTIIPARDWQRPANDPNIDITSVPPHTSPEYRDLRFSADGKYLSYTTIAETGNDDRTVHVIDTTKWQEIVSIPKAEEAFVVLLGK